MSKLNIYATILLIINFCHSLINWLHSKIENCIRLLFLSLGRDDYKPHLSHKLRKLPLHLGLVVLEDDELSFSDLARIIAWSVVVGVSCVSVYDHKGRCKMKEVELKSKSLKEIEKIKEKEYSISCKKAKDYNYSTKNGYHTNLNIDSRVHILDPSDCQSKLIDVTKELCKQNNLISTDINISYVDNLIRKNLSFPDPDLVFRFGSTQSMLGYLPWHMRLTEIFSLPTHRNLGFSKFFSYLDSFADIKQRCGV